MRYNVIITESAEALLDHIVSHLLSTEKPTGSWKFTNRNRVRL